jgi:hypothetical protein
MSVQEAFWNNVNRFWAVCDDTVDEFVIAFIERDLTCCSNSYVDDPDFEEIGQDDLALILGSVSSTILWNLDTNETVKMNRRSS